jgi:hypothetical protein
VSVLALSLEEDTEMHVHLDDGRWHRVICDDLSETACGERINLRLHQNMRPSKLSGALCGLGCFSTREIEKADDNNRKGRIDP